MYGIYAGRHRAFATRGEIVGLLPRGDHVTFFVDAAQVRRAGVFQSFGSAKIAQEPEYVDFVRQTGFDYTRDLDVLAGAVETGQIFFVARGHFDWTRLRAYAVQHGGACKDQFCSAPGSVSGRWVSFLRVDDEVMALAVGPDQSGAYVLSPRRDVVLQAAPDSPVWMNVPHSALQASGPMPTGLQILAQPVLQAEGVLLTISGDVVKPDQFVLEMKAQFKNAAEASTARSGLENRVALVKRSLSRDKRLVPESLPAVVLSGTFRQSDREVIGHWNVSQKLLQTLE